MHHAAARAPLALRSAHTAAVRYGRRIKTGARLWEAPLGSPTRLVSADAAAKIPPEWGSPNLGGPIVTAGGVVFIGAALDRWLHAFDIESGRELWRGPLPESGKATPMSYRLRPACRWSPRGRRRRRVGRGYLVTFRIAAKNRQRSGCHCDSVRRELTVARSRDDVSVPVRYSQRVPSRA